LSREARFSAFDKLTRRIQDEQLLAPLWPDGETVALLDQTRLPFARDVIHIRTAEEMGNAIRQMQIRGSGAIGCAGALGAYLAVRSAAKQPDQWNRLVEPLRNARPTALALRLAVDEVLDAARGAADPLESAANAAVAFFERQIGMERALGRHGAAVIADGATVLTHCHSGALAGAGYGGRALSVIRAAAESGKRISVIAQETRPYFQGARITAWELRQLGVPVTLITDGMSGAVMEAGRVDVCVVGSDRLAINGDLANKTGTYLVALAAREHDVPFYTATTRYNVDPTCPDGRHIPIEFRPGDEVLTINGQRIAAEGVDALYPAFDITPAKLLTGIITEVGTLTAPFEAKLRVLLQNEKDIVA
jgi:methylthioribose-1-phosphate isomerase